MILTVTLNAALDLTYTVDALVPHATHRVRDVQARPGGKGVNVAHVLATLGVPVVATGLVGGATGDRIRELLDDRIEDAFVDTDGESRRTVTLLHDGGATGFWEPGLRITAEDWRYFQQWYASLLTGVHVAVLSGSLPLGAPADAYAQLVATARESGVPSVLDADGAALVAGVRAGPAVVKPNADELAAALGLSEPGPLDAACARLASLAPPGAGTAVVVSAGADGLYANTREGGWYARPPVVAGGNPTGAGDACVAGIARGLSDGLPWPELLAGAAALGAAAVREPVAGVVETAAIGPLLAATTVTPAPGPGRAGGSGDAAGI